MMMERRRFLEALGSIFSFGLCTSATSQDQGNLALTTGSSDRLGSIPSAKKFLFTDYRYIDPGDLRWTNPEGESIPVAGPPGDPIVALADPALLPRGIRLRVQPARKEGPIKGLPTRVFQDGGLYRSWSLKSVYPAGQDKGSYSTAPIESLSVRYGESQDGYTWKWTLGPPLKAPQMTGVDGEFFFRDPHGSPDERYKGIFHAGGITVPDALSKEYFSRHPRHRDERITEDSVSCLFGMVSPDGLNWRVIPDPLMIHKGDTDNTIYYDSWLGKYVLYTRLYPGRRRVIARAESDDFLHWSPVERMLGPSLDDPPTWDVYTNSRTCYPGLPGHHFLFPQFYRRYTQTSEVHLFSSDDGIFWNRVPGGPILEPGNPGEWDGEYFVAGKDLVTLGTGRIAIPFRAWKQPHKYPRWPEVFTSETGWAWWPEGRLCSVEAEEEGEFHTFELESSGESLKVNARVRRAGGLRIGLIGIEGHSVNDCDVFTGDVHDKIVSWKGETAHRIPPGTKVRLHIQLRAGEIFGFEWV